MDFDFVKGVEKQAGGEPQEKRIATGGSPMLQGITPDIKAAARKLAESAKGLNIAEFQRKHNIHVLDVKSLLED